MYTSCNVVSDLPSVGPWGYHISLQSGLRDVSVDPWTRACSNKLGQPPECLCCGTDALGGGGESGL